MRGFTSVSGRKGGRERAERGWILGLLAAMALSLAGCAGSGRVEEDPSEAVSGEARSPESVPAAAGPYPSKGFQEPGELDKLLDAKPMALAAVKPASTVSGAGAAKTAETAASGKGKFRLQLGAESDVDAAQAKKAEYDRLLGGSVDVVFDAPYYKLRWGYFETKDEAEDKLLELSDQKIQGFVIKQ